MKKTVRLCRCALALTLLAGTFLSGCADAGHSVPRTEDGRVIVRVSMYNDNSYPAWRTYVEEQCPGVFIQWENNRNTPSNLLYQAQHGDLPDLMSIRRFETDTAAQLQPYLADLSGLPLTATFDARYLRPFASGGRQYWLPAPGVFDGIVANTDLFDAAGIALPTDMDSFLAACGQLQARGYVAFAMDCASPWTPIQLLEGFGLGPLRQSAAGRRWLADFEAGTADSIDAESFGRVADTLRLLCSRGLLTQEDLNTDAGDIGALLTSGRAAMFRCSSDETFDPTGANHCVALPFFGATAADSVLYTYPVFSVAMNKQLTEENGERAAAAGEVLAAMFSAGAQQVLNRSGEGLISYNTNVHLALSPAMRSVHELIDSGRCFIRTLNSNSFATGSAALQALIDGADNDAFLRLVSGSLFAQASPQYVADSNLAASDALDHQLCCPAASVIAQVLQKQTGADCAVIDVKEAPAPIYKGACTDADINAIVAASSVYTASLSGAQLTQLIDTCLLSSTTFYGNAIEPLLEYPAVAGLTVHMQKDGTVTALRYASGVYNADAVSRVAVSGNVYAALRAQDSPLAALFAGSDRTLKQYFTDGFRADGRLPQPQEYFVVA